MNYTCDINQRLFSANFIMHCDYQCFFGVNAMINGKPLMLLTVQWLIQHLHFPSLGCSGSNGTLMKIATLNITNVLSQYTLLAYNSNRIFAV